MARCGSVGFGLSDGLGWIGSIWIVRLAWFGLSDRVGFGLAWTVGSVWAGLDRNGLSNGMARCGMDCHMARFGLACQMGLGLGWSVCLVGHGLVWIVGLAQVGLDWVVRWAWTGLARFGLSDRSGWAWNVELGWFGVDCHMARADVFWF